ncbi:MAG: GNAT family N-acetyltransferase [Actinobacteria bacterium]|nr:GNAT family N-acetyltransferase [Actinomycetota bacterium]
MQTNSLEDTNIFGDRVELRSVKQSDSELLFRWLNDPEVYRWWGGMPIGSDVIQQKYLGLRRPQVGSYILEVTGMPIGYAQSCQFDVGEGSVDLFLIPEMRRHGYGIAAARTLVEYLAQVEGWRRITVDPEQDNIPAQRFWRKLGFVETEQINLEGNPVLVFKGSPHQSSDGECKWDRAAPHAATPPIVNTPLKPRRKRRKLLVKCWTKWHTVWRYGTPWCHRCRSTNC